MFQAVLCSGVIVALYLSRAVYNIIAVTPIKVPSYGYGWINVTDQVSTNINLTLYCFVAHIS